MERENEPVNERLQHLIEHRKALQEAYKTGSDEEYRKIAHGAERKDHHLIMEDLGRAISEAKESF